MAAVRSGFLLLSLLASCGCASIGDFFDQSAMIQMVTGFEFEEDASTDFGTGAALVHALGLDFTDENDGILLRRDIQTELDRASEKAGEERQDLEEISMSLAQAMSDELIRMVNAEIEAPFQQRGLPVKESPEAWIQKTTQALRRVADHMEKQELKEPVEKWIQKAAEASGAMAGRFMDSYMDWQSVAGSSLMLQAQKTSAGDPDGALVKRNIEQAMHIFSKTTTDDIRQFENISRTVHKAWEAEIHRVVNDFSAMTIGKLSEKSLQWAANRHQNYEHRKKQLEDWMHENVRDGMLEWKMLDYLRRQYVTVSTAVDTWMNNTIDWERLAAGEFMQQKQVVKAASSLDDSAVFDMTSELKARMDDAVRVQADLIAVEQVANEWEQTLSQSIDSIAKGNLDVAAATNLKTSMDASALLAKTYYQITVDLQKIVSAYKRLMSQQDRVDGAAENELYSTADAFQQVVMNQERILEKAAELPKDILEDGQLTPESIDRLEKIVDKSAKRARQWLAKNMELQGIVGKALVAKAKP